MGEKLPARISSHEKSYGFHTTPKGGQIYHINRNSILAFRIIGKGCKEDFKLCLSDPFLKKDCIKYYEN